METSHILMCPSKLNSWFLNVCLRPGFQCFLSFSELRKRETHFFRVRGIHFSGPAHRERIYFIIEYWKEKNPWLNALGFFFYCRFVSDSTLKERKKPFSVVFDVFFRSRHGVEVFGIVKILCHSRGIVLKIGLFLQEDDGEFDHAFRGLSWHYI